MLIERVELTMSHVELGNLNEYALMVLFGNAHSHQLVENLTISPSQIQSVEGVELYPAYFMTQLRVAKTRLLSSFRLWDSMAVGVDVKRFGETLLESNYVIGSADEIGDQPETWPQSGLPTMVGNNLIVEEQMNGETAKRQVANPAPGKIAELEKIRRAPIGLTLSRKMRGIGFQDAIANIQFKNDKPIVYKVRAVRDALDGHAMIFAKYAQIMDVVESEFLSDQMFPTLPHALLRRLSVLERDIYYYGNCFAGEELAISLCGAIELAQDTDFDDTIDFIAAGNLSMNFEIVQKRTGTLVALSQVKKVFAIPMEEQEIINDLRRIVNSL